MFGAISMKAAKIFVVLDCLAFSFFFLTPRIYAQVSGATLSGTITDQSGAAVAGARGSIRNTATGVSPDATTNSSGFYSVPNLLPGPYQVTASANGFATEVNTGVVLTVGVQQVLNIFLRVGQVTERVEVTGEAPSVELASSSISAVVNSTTVVELPLNGRDWTLLATLEPGVNTIATQFPAGNQNSRIQRGFGNELTISGTRPQLNNYRIDGISVVDYSGGAPGSVAGYALGVDAIAEFSVITSNQSAEYGRTSGGVVNAITRSGTNQLHGDAYGFLRSASLDTRNYFDGATIAPFHRSQLGGSAGGPIQKDKTFFFADYEVFRQGLGITHVDRVPSADARNGTLHNTDGTTTTVTVDPVVQTYLKFYPLPNGPLLGTGNTGIFNLTTNANFHDNFVTTRIDRTFSNKDSVSGTYLLDTAYTNQPDLLNDVLLGSTSSRALAAIEETHIFSPYLANSARFGFSRMTVAANISLQAINPLAAQKALGPFPNTPAAQVDIGGVTVFQGGMFGRGRGRNFWNAFQFYDDAFLVKGAHSFKFGFGFERDQANIIASGNEDGQFFFGDLQGFFTNNPTAFGGTLGGLTHFDYRQSIVRGYFQDDWRVRPNLTLNLGLRYEMATVFNETAGKIENLRIVTNPTPVLGAPLFQNPTLRNFAPRVGLAWDPFHNGKTAVRAAFGMFDILPLSNLYISKGSGLAPFTKDLEVGGSFPGVFPFGAANFTSDPTTCQVMWMPFKPPRNYMMIWNLNIEQQITASTTATISYVGNHGVNMENRLDDIDTTIPTPTPFGQLFPFPAGSGTKLNPRWGSISAVYWGGTALYDALEASASKRFSHGFQGQVSYTWGKGIDTGSATVIGDPFTNSITSPWTFWPGRRGLSDYNIAQTFVVNYIWDVPVPKEWGRIASNVLGGWELGGIFTAQTGQPFTPIISGDPLGTNSSDPWAFPDQLRTPGCKAPVNPGNPNNYIKLECFTLPALPASAPASLQAQCTPFPTAPGTCQNLLPNVRRNDVIGPGAFNLDFSLLKNNYVKKISENFNVQFRAEVFNILNHSVFNAPINNSTLFDPDGSPTGGAGAVDQTSNPSREIQFGLKVIF